MITIDRSLTDAIVRWRASPAQMVRDLFQVEPDPWQVEALDAFPTTPRLAMQACAGPGKGHPLSMVVETPRGRRRWGELQVGDPLFAEDGSICSIKAIHPLGVRKLYRVSFDDGSSTLCTEDHLWKVRGRTERLHKRRRDNPEWTPERAKRSAAQGWPATPADGYSVIDTKEILRRGVMTKNRSAPARQFEIPIQGPAQFPRSDHQPIDPYLAGVWLGDGHKGEPCYSKPYPEVEQEIQRRGYTTSRQGIRVRMLESVVSFREFEPFHLHSHERFIPRSYRHASIEQRRDMLCGLMDTDGYIGADSGMEYGTTSIDLAEDIVWIVRSLGGAALIKPTIKKPWYTAPDGERRQGLDFYRVTVKTPFNPFRVPHKAERWRDPSRGTSSLRYMTRYIAGIAEAGEEEAMCVEVDHPSHCYLANDFIVTHNTAVLAWLGWNFMVTRPHPMVGATSVSGANLKSALWPEFSRWRERSPLLKGQFDLTDKAIFSNEYPQTWRIEARTWARDADAAQIGNSLAGLHANYVMWLLDETGDYPDAVLPVCEGIFNGNPVEAHIVQAGNPTRRSGPLWRAASIARNIWKLIRITADPDDPNRTPRVSIEIAREQIQQYGRENPWVKVRIFGEFPDTDFNALIGPDEVEASFRRAYREHDISADAALVFGVDVARFGDDQSVIFPRRGPQAFKPYKYRNLDSTQGSGRLVRLWEDHAADAVFIDNAGLGGGGWIDATIRLGRSPIGIDFGGKPHQTERYHNKRAEMYFDAVEWIKRGGALPEDAELLTALTQTNYTFQKDSGKLILEPKDSVKAKLGYSPDTGDAFVLTFSEPVIRPLRRPTANRQPHVAQQEWNPFAERQPSGIASAVDASYDPYNRR